MNFAKNIRFIVPILLVLLYIIAPKYMFPFSYTLAGRFLALMLIVYYTHINFYIGIVLCLIVIFYYSREDYIYLLEFDEGVLWNLAINRGDIPKNMVVTN